MNRKQLCDEKCNECPLLQHSNSKMLTKIFNELVNKFGDDVIHMVNNNCPGMTVCYNCRIDDFCHVEGCEFIEGER